MTSLFDFFNYEQFMKDVSRHHRYRPRQKAHDGAARHGDHAKLRRRQGTRRISDLADTKSLQAVVDEFEFRPQRPNADPRAMKMRGVYCASRECGFRTFLTTISAARKCASSRTARRKARSASVHTTRASAGVRSSRRCTRRRVSASGTRNNGRHAVYAKGKEVPGISKDAQPEPAGHRKDTRTRPGTAGSDAVSRRGKQYRDRRSVS